ncbi:MAG: hypothetical protein HZB51_07925 [Chloroflexi bacterium]|nr:hypothetical protein [Chloroflexota bacterium]
MRNALTAEFKFLYSLVLAAILPFGLLLYFLPTQTASYWPWVIANPRSAMLIGAVYIAAVVYFLLALKTNDWYQVQADQGGLFIFLSVLVIATMTDWDKFRPYYPTTLIWLAIYYGGPLFLPFIYRLQKERMKSITPGPDVPEPWAMWLVVRGIVYLTIFVIVLVFADAVSALWPWATNSLALRVFSAQIALNGWRAIIILKYGRDWQRQRMGSVMMVLLGLLQLGALAIGPTPYNWSSPLAILLPLMFLEWSLTSAALLYLHRKSGELAYVHPIRS